MSNVLITPMNISISSFSLITLFIVISCLPSAYGDIALDPFTPHSTEKYLKYPYGLDEDGILVFDYGERYGGIGKFYNATFTAAYANALFRDYVNGDKSAKKEFLKNVDFLIESAQLDESGACWPFPFSNDYFGAPSGWYSGMTNGRVLGVLTRAHYITGNKKYFNFAKKVERKLIAPLKERGMSTYEDDSVWIEEVAWEDGISSKVVNGHIFGLSGMWIYAQYLGEKKLIDYCRKAFFAIEKDLPAIDTGYLSYYSEKSAKKLRMHAEKGGYHVIHIHQLLWLYSITQKKVFLEYAIKFASYEYFIPEIDATFSTNKASNGPAKMNLSFGNSYWSSYKFPVTITLKFPETIVMDGITLLGHTEASTPRNFYIEAFDGAWKGLAKQVDNFDQRLHIPFTYDVTASKVRITVNSDNGNRAVALDGLGIHIKQYMAPVVDHKNFTIGFKKIRDGDLSTGLLFKKPGWLIVPNTKKAERIEIFMSDISSVREVLVSNDLSGWIPYKNYQCSNNSIEFIGLYFNFVKMFVDIKNKLKLSEVKYVY